MKKSNFFKIAILILGMTMSTACSKDDGIGGNENPPANNTNTTATTSVKSITLTAAMGVDYTKVAWVHEDFSRRYGLLLYNGGILILSQQRKDGQWSYARAGNESCGSGISDVKEVGQISDITSRSLVNAGKYDNYGYYTYGMTLPFYPSHGYAACFTTGDGEILYMRIFAKGYTLDKEGALATITLQYQLY